MPTIFFLNILKFIKTSLFSLFFNFSVCAGTFLIASRTCSHIWYYTLRNIDWIVSSRFWSIDMLRIHKYAFHHSRLISASIHIKLKMKRSITYFSAHCLGREKWIAILLWNFKTGNKYVCIRWKLLFLY